MVSKRYGAGSYASSILNSPTGRIPWTERVCEVKVLLVSGNSGGNVFLQVGRRVLVTFHPRQLSFQAVRTSKSSKTDDLFRAMHERRVPGIAEAYFIKLVWHTRLDHGRSAALVCCWTSVSLPRKSRGNEAPGTRSWVSNARAAMCVAALTGYDPNGERRKR